MIDFLEGKKDIVSPRHEFLVQLRPLHPKDRGRVKKWLMNPYVVHLTFVVTSPSMGFAQSLSKGHADLYFDALLEDPRRKTFALLVDGLHVGNIGLKSIQPAKKTAELFIEIGEGAFRGKGVGTRAMILLLEKAATELDLYTIFLEVLEFNNIAIRLYQKLGFISTGYTGWHYDHFGQYWQVLGMLRDLHK